MNERIKELSEQAEKYADENFRGEPTWSEAFESKFAELIVRECANYMNSRLTGNIEVAYTVAKMKQRLLGVKE